MSRYAAKVVTYFDADVDHYIKQLNRADRRNKAFARNTRQAANDSARAIEQSFRGAGRGIAAIDGSLGGISGRFSALTALVSESGAAFALMGASVAGVVAMLGAAAFEGAKVEQLQLKTQAILKATGNAAGFTATELDRQARAIALATLASVDGVRGAQHRLLTSPAIYRSDIEALNGPITFTFTHIPGSGVRRYVMEMLKVSGDTATVSHRHLRALGLKDNG